MKFHIYFNWLPTYEEYIDYLDNEEAHTLDDWHPDWLPHLEFVNLVEQHKLEWETYPLDGKFRLKKLKPFGYMNKKNMFANTDCAFNGNDALFLRCKLECDLTLAEEFELENFPLGM